MYYETNFSILMDHHPRLAKRLQALVEDGFYLIKTPNGDYTVRLFTEKGKEIYLHSRYNPRLESLHWIKGVEISAPTTYFLVGLGLGYGLFNLIKRMNEKSNVVVIEKRMDLFKCSLTLFDWSDIFRDRRVKFIIKEGLEESHRRIDEYFPNDFLIKIEVLKHKPSLRLYPQYYTEIIKQIHLLIEKRRVEMQRMVSLLREDYERVDQAPRTDEYPHTRDRMSYRNFYERLGGESLNVDLESYYEQINKGNRLSNVIDNAKGNCLDIGCQWGGFCIELAKRGHFVVGVDISLQYLRQAISILKDESKEVQDRIRYLQSFAEELPIKDESFQTVLLGEILEHVINPHEVLKEALRVLKKGGLLYISVPASIYTLNGYKAHVRIFSERSLLNLLKRYEQVLDFDSIRWISREPLTGFYQLTVEKKHSFPQGGGMRGDTRSKQ